MSRELAAGGAAHALDGLDGRNLSEVLYAKMYSCLNLDTITHNVCNHQAVQIIKSDGWCREAGLITRYMDQIDMGTSWADNSWRGFSHCYNPVTGRGFFNCPSAVFECRRYYRLAKTCICKQRFARGFFYLGAALHLVQDLCVPHHSHNVLLSGHQRFEKWAEAHVENYLVFKGCSFDRTLKDPGEWVISNARASFDLYPFTSGTSPKDYHTAARAMLPRAQRTSAGFLLFFLGSAFHQ